MGRRSRRDAADWVALLLARPAARALSRLAGWSRSAGEIFALPDKQLREEFGVRAEELARLRAPVDAKAQQAALDAWERHGMRLITLGEPEYPRNLLSSGSPPGALFVRGELLPEDTLALAIVGSRAASASGLEMASRLAREFAPIFTIVSGCALGIDSASHAAALNAGGRTIGVAACGLDVDYPSASRALREHLLACGRGVIVSPFLPGTQAMRANFPQRNAVLAGMSLAAVIVEAASRSGALSTARFAADDGRPVYAVPGDATRATSEGTNALIREGASVCTRAADVIADLEGMLTGEMALLRESRPALTHVEPAERAPIPGAAPPRAPRESEPLARTPAPPRATAPRVPVAPAVPATAMVVPADATPLQREILMRLSAAEEPLHKDALAQAYVPDRASMGELAEALLMLELTGCVKQLPGGLISL